MPKSWIDARIITLFRNKGVRTDCNNSRGIFLLSLGGKILARIMLSRLVKNISECILPESQCGFRKERGTIDMIFTLRQVQEKCVEQNTDLYIAFIDLTKAFDTVPRELLWKLLAKYGVPNKFLKILQLFHSNMEATVSISGMESPSFPVEVGVKQGDVLAPVLFNLFLSTITVLMQNKLREVDGVQIEYRLDGNLFNLRRLQARTKTSSNQLVDLQYADDAAILAHTANSMQHTLDALSALYQAFGVEVSTRKTEVLVQQVDPNQDVPIFTINGTQLQTVPLFRYLGSNINPTTKIDDDVLDKIYKASRTFW